MRLVHDLNTSFIMSRWYFMAKDPGDHGRRTSQNASNMEVERVCLVGIGKCYGRRHRLCGDGARIPQGNGKHSLLRYRDEARAQNVEASGGASGDAHLDGAAVGHQERQLMPGLGYGNR